MKINPMKKYLSLVLLCGALTPWALAVDDADTLNANDNIDHAVPETVVTMQPSAQTGQAAFSLPRHTLGLVNKLTVLLQNIKKGSVQPGMIFSFTADSIAKTASLKQGAEYLQAWAPENTKITDVFKQLDNLSSQLGLPSGNDYSAFLKGTLTPVTHAVTLLNQVVRSSMEGAIDILETYMALIINGETVTDADIRPALEDFTDALIAATLLANYALSENVFWHCDYSFGALFEETTCTVPHDISALMQALFNQSTINSATTVRIRQIVSEMRLNEKGKLNPINVRTTLATELNRPEINEIPTGELLYFFRTFCHINNSPILTKAQSDYLDTSAASFLVLANGLVAQLMSGQDLIANNLLGDLFPVLPADMPLEERENMPAELIYCNDRKPMAQEALNNLPIGGNWGGITAVRDSIL